MGTVTPRDPPGFNTRCSSEIAVTSSWMCSNTSEVTTQSNVLSAKGRRVASPRRTPPKLARGISRSCTMPPKTARVPTTSSCAQSSAYTVAPWRAASKAWRPKPAPASRNLSPGRRPSLLNRIVSMVLSPLLQFGSVVRHFENLAVLLNSELCAVSPTPARHDALATVLSDARTKFRAVETAANSGR